MPISVKCCDCGKALKAPDALAGKKAKCPDCGAVVAVPNPEGPIESNGGRQDVDFDELADDGADVATEDNTTRKPCPMCGELIAATAAKCRFCGETLSSTVRNRERQTASTIVANQLTGADIAICALCFPIGCVVGIVAIITGQPARGLKMIGLAIVMPFLWGAILSIFQ
jgi:predicted RNA-binding Zn-ribbon protein involved in translation (DUF1610 family)